MKKGRIVSGKAAGVHAKSKLTSSRGSLQNTFFQTETQSRGRGGFGGGGGSGEELITFQGDVSYNKNPYLCIPPLL